MRWELINEILIIFLFHMSFIRTYGPYTISHILWYFDCLMINTPEVVCCSLAPTISLDSHQNIGLPYWRVKVVLLNTYCSQSQNYISQK